MVKQLLKITWRQFCFVLYVLPLTLLVLSCSVDLPEHLVSVDENPKIQPSVSGITIPPNIAPLNFKINEEGKWYWAEVFGSLGDKILLKSSNGIIQFPQKAWKKLLSENKGNKISIQVIVENQNGEAKSLSHLICLLPTNPSTHICFTVCCSPVMKVGIK